jgi:hypothetical protein
MNLNSIFNLSAVVLLRPDGGKLAVLSTDGAFLVLSLKRISISYFSRDDSVKAISS